MPRNRKRYFWLLIIFLLVILLAAYATKPSDKDCIMAAVEKVWGPKTPQKTKFPEYYEQFMDLNSKHVTVEDWLFFKRVRYKIGLQNRTVAYAAFNRIFT